MSDFNESLKLVLQIATVVGVTLAAYWSRKDLVTTRRVRKQLANLPPALKEAVHEVLKPIASKLTEDNRDDSKRNPT